MKIKPVILILGILVGCNKNYGQSVYTHLMTQLDPDGFGFWDRSSVEIRDEDLVACVEKGRNAAGPLKMQIDNYLTIQLPQDVSDVVIRRSPDAQLKMLSVSLDRGQRSQTILPEASTAEDFGERNPASSILPVIVTSQGLGLGRHIQFMVPVTRASIICRFPPSDDPKPINVEVVEKEFESTFALGKRRRLGRSTLDSDRFVLEDGTVGPLAHVRSALKASGVGGKEADAAVTACGQQLLSLSDEQLFLEILSASSAKLKAATDITSATRYAVLLTTDHWEGYGARPVLRYKDGGTTIYLKRGSDQGSSVQAVAFDRDGSLIWNAATERWAEGPAIPPAQFLSLLRLQSE